MTTTVPSIMLTTTLSTLARNMPGTPNAYLASAPVSPVLSCPVQARTVQSCGPLTQTEKTFRNGKHLSFCRESEVVAQRERAHIRVIAPSTESQA